MFGALVKLLHSENGFTAIEYSLVITMSLILAGQLASQFNAGQ